MSDESRNPNDNLDENLNDSPSGSSPDDMGDRLERLGGEPAPAITPEEFERLQKAGQVHIDSRGRVRTARRSGAEAGVSLRKRRAWYDRGLPRALVS
ncbi:MAG: hypothetical protein OXG53_15230 [Chloroflexi bacterium]|nr:hypothetical protein [Chloroflexota bacterium]